MKTAKPPPALAAEPHASRRSQPVRQTRTNPSRSGGGIGRGHAQKDRASGAASIEQPIEIFPALTHFTDTITDLPQALARHFTLLKEVDAKVHAPEQALFELIREAIALPNPEATRSLSIAASSIAPGSAPMSTQNSSNGVPPNDRQTAANASVEGSTHGGVYDPSNIPRRQLFRQIAFKIQEMLVSLEEKNHVIATANNELSKRQGRITNLWGALELEFSEEARNGSSTHWAYAENRAGRSNNTPADRSRRDGVAVPPPVPPPAVEEAASRSDARKQAVAARKEKNAKAHTAHESDVEDTDPKHQKAEASKKSHPTKSRKTAQPASEAATPVGLGITAPSPVNGNPAPKRRKVEKPTNGATPTERAMSSVFGNSAPKQKTASPRETPVPENQSKKRKALPSSGNQAKKSRNGTANPPSVASSPVIGTFPEQPPKVIRNSPVPIPTINTRAPATARAKPTPPAQPTLENGRPRPSSAAASNKPNGVVAPAPVADVPAQINGARPTNTPGSEAKSAKEQPAPKQDVPKADIVLESTTAIPPPVIPSLVRKDPPAVLKRESSIETRKESSPVALSGTGSTSTSAGSTVATNASTITTTSVTTKSGRASKPSTPALGSFPDNVRARPSRASEGAPHPPAKRSHKKGASSIALANPPEIAQRGSDGGGPVAGSGGAGEELYCYCMQPSYGDMVACDAEGCAREWFHYECAGLKAAPKGNTKWYCKECKKRLNIPEKKSNGT